MSKHTPGPWFAKEGNGFYIVASDHFVVDSYDVKGRYGPITNEADARLIAAAPELLEALIEITTTLCKRDTFSKARDAIAKARGDMA